MTLLPVVPLLLVPFIVVFFITVFPAWLIAMLVLLGARAVVRLAIRDANHPLRLRVEKAYHWVKTFGGFTDG